MNAGKRLVDLIALYIGEIRELRNHNTAKLYAESMRAFAAYGIALDNNALVAYERALKHDKHKPGTVQTRLAGLRAFLTWLESRGQLPRGFSRSQAEARLKGARGSRKGYYKPKTIDARMESLRRYYDDRELPALPQLRLELLRNRALVHVLFSSAVRAAEAAALTREQVADGHVAETMVVGKGDKPRMIFFDREAQAAIQAYCAARMDKAPGLFISHRRGLDHTIDPDTVYRIVHRAAEGLGLARNTSPHSIRHYVARDMANRGIGMEIVQKVLGHSDIRTTQMIYAEIVTPTVREHVRRYQAAREREQEKGAG